MSYPRLWTGTRRERKRISAYRGIFEYSWSDDGKALLFPMAGDIYVYDLPSPPEKATKRLTETDEFETVTRFMDRHLKE